jgi:hypothetical protein
MALGLSSNDALSIEFWRTLDPELSILAGKVPPELGTCDLASLGSQLRFEGYVNVPGMLSDALVEKMHACVERLYKLQIPLPFAFVYDEFWHAFQSVAGFIEAVLGKGYQALPDFWVWYVAPSESAAGWTPHRDRTIPTLDRDNSPHTLTVWLAITDASPLNGCMYILPAHLDESFKKRVWDFEGHNVVNEPQNIRALPASAGSMLAWNQAVLHWGGRASRLAPGPRVSAAFEFQRGDKPPFNTPLIEPRRMPDFRQRLGLIAKQVLQYQHMYPLAPDIARLAEMLRDRFMPGGALSL